MENHRDNYKLFETCSYVTVLQTILVPFPSFSRSLALSETKANMKEKDEIKTVSEGFLLKPSMIFEACSPYIRLTARDIRDDELPPSFSSNL